MSVTVVVGLQWGDEGKGKLVDLLSAESDIVVRFSGGCNAGHSVVTNDKNVLFSLIPSAALNAKPTLVIADGVIVDPFFLVREIKALKEKHSFDDSRLIVSGNCVVTLPYHQELDRISEKIVKNNAIGTTGWGIGPTKVDQVARQGIRLFEFLDENFVFNGGIEGRILRVLTQGYIFSHVAGGLYQYEELYKDMRATLLNYLGDTVNFLNNAADKGQNILFEGSQGTMLDVLYGTYPYVTSSSTLAGAVSTGGGLGPTKIDKVVGVMKAYSTRVSQGPFPTEVTGKERDYLVQGGHEYRHESTIPLRVGWLDLMSLQYAVRLNAPTELAVSKLDALSNLPEVKVCIGYTKNGNRINSYPVNTSIEAYEPVYESFEGWERFENVHSYNDLPISMRKYISFLESQLNTPIRVISYGPKRHETIYR